MGFGGRSVAPWETEARTPHLHLRVTTTLLKQEAYVLLWIQRDQGLKLIKKCTWGRYCTVGL